MRGSRVCVLLFIPLCLLVRITLRAPPPSPSPLVKAPSAMAPRAMPPRRGALNVSAAYFINGGMCNRLLELAYIYTYATELNAHIVIHSRLANRLRADFDIERMQQQTNGAFIFDFSGRIPPAASFIQSRSDYPPVHCASRLSLDFFASVLRPNRNHASQAERQVAELRARGAQSVVSVHARGFERQGCRGTLNKFGPVCHARSRMNGGNDTVDVLCDTALKTVRVLAAREWPHVRDWSRAGFYVSTDNQESHAAADASYFAGRDAPVAAKSTKNTSMVTDMWTSALADFYLAQPTSTCEPIIAQWRLAANPAATRGTMYPKDCFDNFALPEEPVLSCAHVDKVVTLSDGGAKAAAAGCDVVRALAHAIDVASPGGGLWLWGPYAAWVRRHFPTRDGSSHGNGFQRAYPDVEPSFKAGSPNRGFFAESPRPHFWGALLLDFANATASARPASVRRLAELAGLNCTF